MTRHEGTRADPTDGLGDPLCALLAADSPEHSLTLLPAAVRRAAELAEQLRDSIRLRGESSDPLLVELTAAMNAAALTHERFVTTWSQTATLGMITQSALEDDVCGLTSHWASVIGVVARYAAPAKTEPPIEP